MAFWNNIDSYHFNDRYSKFALSEIPNGISKIQSLIVRRKSHELVANHFYTLAGALEMLIGMCYHYQNVLKLKVELGIELFPDSRIMENIQHESIAYLNRVGQFYHFATSKIISARIADINVIAPTLCNAIVFRNKHAAHRSIDKPRNQDTPYMQEQHAISMNKYGGFIWLPKPGHRPSNNRLERDWSNYYPTSQVQLDDGKTVLYFSVEKDHSKLTSEAYAIFEAALSPKK